MLLLLTMTTLLSSAPSTAPVRKTVRTELDLGGLMGSTWFIPSGRARLEAAIYMTTGAMAGTAALDPESMSYGLPVVGPWLSVLGTTDNFDRAALVASGILQSLGIAVTASRIFTPSENVVEAGPLLRFSPIAAGHLGVSLRVSGF